MWEHSFKLLLLYYCKYTDRWIGRGSHVGCKIHKTSSLGQTKALINVHKRLGKKKFWKLFTCTSTKTFSIFVCFIAFQAALRMFIDLDFLGRFHIDYTVLCRWLVSVRKNYRAVTYHNWRHAFNVAQMMFATVTSTHWWKKFGEVSGYSLQSCSGWIWITFIMQVEVLSLVIGCLCHDLDHRGTNNSFQVKSRTKLAELYSTSTMEHHHFDQCLMILNSKGNQILANLSQVRKK